MARWWEDLARDLRYAVRSLLKQKAFAATAIVTLALGIGANTAIFSVVNGVVLRPLPFAHPDRLIQLYETTPLTPQGGAVTWANLDAFRQQSAAIESLVGYAATARYLRAGDGFERVMTVRAEREFFSMLGVPPLAGRTFHADDPVSVAVIGEALWERMGGDASVIGRSLVLDGEACTIVGVMPESFQFPYGAASALPGVASEARTDVWTPLDPPAQLRTRINYVTGRLKPNASLTAAEVELALIAKRLERESPDANKNRGVRIVALSDAVVSSTVRRPLFFLFGAVALVLALACANVTNLSLARMTLRSREVAVRAAIGADPLRLARQFLTESLLLSFTGGALGFAIAWWGTSRLMVLVRAQIPRAHEVGLDWRVFLFLLIACALIAAAFGIAPAIAAWRTDPQAVLQDSSSRSTLTGGQRRLRDSLVIAEVAFAFILAIGAALLVRDLARLRSTDTGMSTSNVLTFHLGQRMTPGTDVRQFYDIAERVGRLPGVRAAGFTQLLPLQNWGWTSNSNDFTVRGRPPLSPIFTIELRDITPGYFDALGIAIRRGRAFTTQDTRGTLPVIVINETLARRYFGNDDPIGVTVIRGTIVGVAADVRQVNVDRSASPEIYYPIAQNWSQLSELGMSLVVRAQDRPEPLVDAVRSAIRDVNPNQAVFSVKTMDSVVEDSLKDFTLFLWLMGSFAALGLVLASTGTYGVIAYIATSRMREFAIRLALGADSARVTRLVLGQGMRLTAIGLGVGLFGALAATPLLQNLPVTVRPPDVITAALVAALIGAIAIIACLVPARRAASADPMSTLRNE